MTSRTRLLGIDPGLRCMGWGVIDVSGNRMSHVAHGTIKPPTEQALSDRLTVIFRGVLELVETYQPDECAIEEAFMAKNASSALKLGHARAAALLAPASMDRPVFEYAARLVKKAVVGTGGADKTQVSAMVGVLLPGVKATADAADALAIAICHAHTRNTHVRGEVA